MQNRTDRIRRVAAGAGGDAIVLIGSEKTAVIDTGMAYYGEKTAENIARLLAGRPLDYVLASHTHYDHIGALSYLRRRWPQLISVGNEHAQEVMKKPGALKRIRQLSEGAAVDHFQREDCLPLVYEDDDMGIDQVVSEGDVISLGDRQVRVLETPGHTNCSLSFHILEEDTLFAAESIGCYVGNGQMVSAILTSYHKSMESIEKCRNVKSRAVISPHYGLVRRMSPDEYFDLAKQQAETVKDFILVRLNQGIDKETLLDLCKQEFWYGPVRKEQPEKAFLINTEAMINVIEREFLA